MDQFNFSDYPTSNFNEVNLDWVCDELKADKEQIAQNTADIEELKNSGVSGDYEDLSNLPQINSVTLIGDKSLDDIGAVENDGYVFKHTPYRYAQVGGDFDRLLSCGAYFINDSVTPVNGPFGNTAFNGTAIVFSMQVSTDLWFTQVVLGDNPTSVRGHIKYRNIKFDGTGATAWRDFTSFAFDYASLQAALTDYTPTAIGTPPNKNFNLLTATGCYYVNGTASSPLINAPMGLTESAIVLINTPMRISSARSVLQTAIIQNPSYHRHEVWYRFMSDDASSIYLDWFTNKFPQYVKKITVFGDSISAGYPQTSSANYHWWEFLKPYYNITNYAETGAGVVYQSSGVSGCTMADSFTDTTNSYAVIFLGTNDWGNNIALGTPTDTPSSSGSFCAGLRYMIEKICTTNTQMSIIGVLPINRTKLGTTNLSRANNYAYGTANTAGYTLGDLCEAAKTIYENYGIPVIDSRYSGLQLFNLANFLGDGLHPNAAGYKKLAGFLGGQIRSIVGNV